MPAEFNLGTLNSNGTPTVASNFVGSSDTRDTFSFTLGTSNNINLALTGLSNDADFSVYRDFNSNGIVDVGDTLVGSSARGGSADDSINIADQAAGAYVVQVDRFSGDTKYDLRLSTTSFRSPSNLLPTETEIGSLTTSQTFSSQVGNNDTSDIFHFVVNAARSFRFALSGLTGDADLRLIQDRNSDLVVQADEVIATSTGGSTFADSITQSLNPGDNYFVQVYQFAGIPTDSSSINYTLTATPA
jgi:hypothetical protein